jgi:branched-chain amino acid transport system permease protein
MERRGVVCHFYFGVGCQAFRPLWNKGMVKMLRNLGKMFWPAGSQGKGKWRSDHCFVWIAAFLLVFPIFVQDAYILNVFIIAFIFAALAASWNLIVGYTGLFTFGHQAFFAIGAYVSSLLAMKAGISPWLGMLLGGIAASFLSFIIGLPCLRLRSAPYVAITTLAFSEIARITCMNLPSLTRGEAGLWGIPNFPDIPLLGIGMISFGGGARIPYYYLILLVLIVIVLIMHYSLNSHIGLAFKSIRDSQDAAESLGINITHYKLLAFMLSAFFAGVVGSIYAHYILILTPTSVFNVGLMVEVLAFTIIGGLGTLIGPILSAVILTIALEYMRLLGDYRLMTYGLLLVIVVIFMPEGIGRRLFRDKEILE